jgi:hypothetical protein
VVTEKTSTGVRTVSQVALEMRSAIISLAGERAVYDSRDRWLERAARAAGISRRAAKTLFYAESNNPGSEVVEKVRAALTRKKDAEDDGLAKLARDEYREFVARIERIERALGISDQDMHSDQITAFRRSLGADRGPMGRK